MADENIGSPEVEETEEVTNEPRINARAIAGLIADYLENRDDISDVSVIALDTETGTANGLITTQGSGHFAFTVAPTDVNG